MKRRLLDILACPVCKHHPLELHVIEENEKEIVQGVLRCPKCQINYQIENGIPNMIPPERNGG
ncbi:MAG: methytransferase partner Trm112 [Methanomassiliicoccales archaeon]|nr:methytransferase partner Trm112 [Methanomassiliicoccales archaeon]